LAAFIEVWLLVMFLGRAFVAAPKTIPDTRPKCPDSTSKKRQEEDRRFEHRDTEKMRKKEMRKKKKRFKTPFPS